MSFIKKHSINKLSTITWETFKISFLALLVLILIHISSPQSAQKDFILENAKSSFGTNKCITFKVDYLGIESLKKIT